jgi:two-component system nitrogen regulation sensor histidine kinase NtrY
MNISTSPEALRPPPPEQSPRQVRSWLGWLADLLLGKAITLVLTGLALAVGLSTFLILARGASPFALEPNSGVALVLANLSVLLLLGAVLAGRLTRVWAERRRGSAGSSPSSISASRPGSTIPCAKR